MSSVVPTDRTNPTPAFLTPSVRAVPTVASDELEKDGSNRASLVPRAGRATRLGPESRNPVCGVKSELLFVRRKIMQLAFRSPSVLSRCAGTTSCPTTRFTAWPRPSSGMPRSRAVRSSSPIPDRRRVDRASQSRLPALHSDVNPRTRRRQSRARQTQDLSRHVSWINGTEAKEMVLLNSHVGTSGYQI